MFKKSFLFLALTFLAAYGPLQGMQSSLWEKYARWDHASLINTFTRNFLRPRRQDSYELPGLGVTNAQQIHVNLLNRASQDDTQPNTNNANNLDDFVAGLLFEEISLDTEERDLIPQELVSVESASLPATVGLVSITIGPQDINRERLNQLKQEQSALIEEIVLTNPIFQEEYDLLREYFPKASLWVLYGSKKYKIK